MKCINKFDMHRGDKKLKKLQEAWGGLSAEVDQENLVIPSGPIGPHGGNVVHSDPGRVMSSEEYVTEHGYVCPECRATSVDGSDIEYDGEMVHRPMSCASCGSTWSEQYNLSGYTGLNPSNAASSGELESPPETMIPNQYS